MPKFTIKYDASVKAEKITDQYIGATLPLFSKTKKVTVLQSPTDKPIIAKNCALKKYEITKQIMQSN
jgi:hypothetical protein